MKIQNKIKPLAFLGMPSNYAKIDNFVSRSAQPKKEDLYWLKEQGVTDVINFRTMYAPAVDFDEAEELKKLGIEKITGGVVIDLGASYHQLTKAERGFSFSKDAPLDMRFNMQADFSAYDVVNTYKEADLVRIFSEYGEERFSKRIAKKIIETRAKKKIQTTGELASLIISATPSIKSSIHPATRVFQAIRIEVNNELKNVNFVLHEILDLLDKGAIISVISFHSLEDRIVKQVLKFESQKCRCNEMICKCPPPKIELVNKKPIMASDEEIKENPPSRSAKLRVARCIF